jgi:hypothetical protein
MIENSIVLGLVEVGMCNGVVCLWVRCDLIGDELGVVWCGRYGRFVVYVLNLVRSIT